jgi:hypothetical protein
VPEPVKTDPTVSLAQARERGKQDEEARLKEMENAMRERLRAKKAAAVAAAIAANAPPTAAVMTPPTAVVPLVAGKIAPMSANNTETELPEAFSLPVTPARLVFAGEEESLLETKPLSRATAAEAVSPPPAL